MTQAVRRVFRFAPTPNGLLHRGHAFSALLNAQAAAMVGGRFLLRIEDIDPDRSQSGFIDAIAEDLAWLGLDWERPVLRQSERTEAYNSALLELQRLGLVYPAFLSRTEIAALVTDMEAGGRTWPRDPDGAPLYPGPERDWPDRRRREEIATCRPFTWRVDQRLISCSLQLSWRESDPAQPDSPEVHRADLSAWGDVVVARKGMPASYHLAVVVDDAFQAVTDVVRGLDLKPSTAVHRMLQTLLGCPEPRYFHHRLILDESGRKLSKSRGSETIRSRRAAGETPASLAAGLGLDLRSIRSAGSATPSR